MKLLIARLFEKLKLNDLFRYLSFILYSKNHIRVLNYHGTSEIHADSLEIQLQWYKKHYTNVSYEELNDFFTTKKWVKDQPGLIISFDDGHKNNFTVARPLLEKYGFTGWFCIPTVLCFDRGQPDYMNSSFIRENDNVSFISRDELKALSGNHVITSHTINHVRAKDSVESQTLHSEIDNSKKMLETFLGRSVDIFTWVGGESWSYSRQAYVEIIQAGYKYAFTTNMRPITKSTSPYFIDRVNVEAGLPLSLVKFYLSGIYDLYYLIKRIRIKSKLRG